ncbi:MAG: histidine phosphatase family protein [Burkholderiaceae bacterium]
MMVGISSSFRPRTSQHLIFVRHGATEANLAGLRCGGDLDPELTEFGRRQAAEAALRIQELRLPVGVILTSALLRARESAQIISRMLGGLEIMVVPAFAERRLGAWNLRPVAETQAQLEQGVTPPGGESNADFIERIALAVDQLLPRLPDKPLLVGSKGVARAMGELLGNAAPQALSNGQLAHFDFAAFACGASTGTQA